MSTSEYSSIRRQGHSCSVTIEVCHIKISINTRTKWTASSEFGTYRLCEQQRFRRACASAQSRQNLRCSLMQAVSQEEPSDRKPDPWPLWMAGHAQLKFVMTECSKTQIRLTGLKWKYMWTRGKGHFFCNLPNPPAVRRSSTCSNIFPKITGPIKVNFHVDHP